MAGKAAFCPKCGAKAQSEPAVQKPSVDLSAIWPEWTAEKVLGRGSYGVVYEAVRSDSVMEMRSAVKVLSIPQNQSEVESIRAEGLGDEGTRTYFYGIVSDFVSEIRLMESLKGVQNIVSVEDYKVVERKEELGWDIYIRMELLRGFNAYAAEKPLSESDVIKLGIDICSALEICEKRNVIHRDIKPENIFVNDFGHFKLGDFGIARKLENMSGGLSQKGTVVYMAPEVVTGTDYDARVDIYSLGIVLYRLLNRNRFPFIETEAQQMNPNERRIAVDRRIKGERLPAPSEASEGMADIILRACAYNPDGRFENASAMKKALLELQAGTYVPVPMTDGTTVIAKGAFVPAKAQPNAPGTAFGKKKKLSVPVILAIVSALLVLTIAAALAIPAIFGSESEKDKKPGKTTAVTTEAVTEDGIDTNVLNEASTLYDEENYKDALVMLIGAIEEYEDHNGENESNEAIKYKDDLLELAAMSANEYASDVSEEADALVSELDYEGAITLLTEAQELLGSCEFVGAPQELSELLDGTRAKYESFVLTEAEALANGGSYAEAVTLLESSRELLEDSTAVEDAIEGYKLNLGKAELMASAAGLYESGKVLEAYGMIASAAANAPDDGELAALAEEYLNAYVDGKISEADALMKAKDLAGAEAVLTEALNNVPGNSGLTAKLSEVKDAAKAEDAPASGDEYVEGNPNKNPTPPESGKDVDVAGGSDSSTAAEITKENVNHASFTKEKGADFYKFTTSANFSLYRTELKNNSVDATLKLVMYDGYDNELGSVRAGKGDTAYLDLSLEANTAYYFKVYRDYYDDRAGNYQFSVNELVCDAGTSKDNSFKMLTDTEYTKKLDAFEINDWYRFTASESYSVYRFDLKNNNIDSTLYLTVYDMYDTELGSANTGKGDSGHRDLVLEAGKEYYVKISRYYGDRTGNYQFSVNELVCDAGLTSEEAFELKTDNTVISTLDSVFEDWYYCDFDSDGEYTLTFTNNSIDSTAYVTAYDELGTELYNQGVSKNDTASLTKAAAAGDRVYFKITRYYSDRNGNYTMTITK